MVVMLDDRVVNTASDGGMLPELQNRHVEVAPRRTHRVLLDP
jgi:hypothetical protein